MAKAKNNARPAGGAPPPVPAAPTGSGWSGDTPDDAIGYFVPFEGAVLQGIVRGRFARVDDPDATYFQVEVTEPCVAVMSGTKDEREPIPADETVGEIVNVDERAAMKQAARDLVGREIFLRVGAKRDIGKGQTFWPIAVQSRDVEARKPPTTRARTARAETADVDAAAETGETPF